MYCDSTYRIIHTKYILRTIHQSKQVSPATAPIIIAPSASVTSHPAVIATSPASEAFRHIDTSGLPYLSHVKIIHTTVASAGAIVVVTKIEPSCSTDVAAAPLNPYQPSQRMNTPNAPIVMLCPGIAFTFVIFPFLSFVNFPIRGPKNCSSYKSTDTTNHVDGT